MILIHIVIHYHLSSYTALIVGYAVRECFVNGSWAPKADYSVCMEQIKGVIEEDKKKEDKHVSLLER